MEKEGAILVGINSRQIHYLTFGIGSACVGAAGAAVLPFFYCSPNVGYAFVIPAFVVVVLGGMGNMLGGFIGAFIIGVVTSVSAVLTSTEIADILALVIFIAVILVRPQGLLGIKVSK